MKVVITSKAPAAAPVVAVGVLPGRRLTPAAATLDAATGGALTRALRDGRFDGARDQLLDLRAPDGVDGHRLILIGLGKPAELDRLASEEIGGRLVAYLAEEHEPEATILIDAPEQAPVGVAEIAAHLGLGARLRAYRFDRYRTKRRPEDPAPMRRLTLVTDAVREARRLFRPLDAAASGVAFARDLVNGPGNAVHPESFVDQARALTELGVGVEVVTENQLRKLGMNALLAVGGGSAHRPRLLVLRWRGSARRNAAPFAFVGKGVTFDTGGISIKPANRMEEMKGDMAGGAAVVGLMRTLAEREAAVDVVGVIPLVENMVSGQAYRPGDVVTTLSGRTIEVVDTDAEGRMILIDALHYTATRFKPKAIVDMATLTGSVVRALGHVYAGVFANDDDLAERLAAAGRQVGERLWRLPLDPDYDDHLKSDIADIRQCAPDEDSADAVHAAQLLQRFIGDVPWAHLDIAGRDFNRKARPTGPVGATGFGVRLLDAFLAGHEDRS
ncbi:leucyl aminopeptidase [Rhodospirillaceae bacterium SYSU D60014]|uniref:leucyl aminopeptidase n=1 Tax=Virgifigura deserti TaxID=2268457 RepID=UPI000E675863